MLTETNARDEKCAYDEEMGIALLNQYSSVTHARSWIVGKDATLYAVALTPLAHAQREHISMHA